MNYYYSIGGADVAGPHSLAELKDLQRSGALPPSTQVCREGEQDWQSVVSILAAPPVPVPPSGEWYYSQNGKRIGPVTLDVISSLVTSQAITRDTQIWREGMSEWTHAGKTELEGLFGAVRTPPPLMGESVSNRLVWILAFAPIIGASLGQLIELAVGFPECGILITIILNIGLGLADEKQLKHAGHDTKGMGIWAVLLVPVYLFVRARRLKQRPSYAIVWLVMCFLAPNI